MNHKNAAIYGNGETDRLPLTGTNQRKIVSKTSTAITLEQPLGPEVTIQPGVTKVRLHSACQQFMFPALANKELAAETWETFEVRSLTGEAFGPNNEIFRPDTKYIRLGFLANHQ